MAKKHSYKVQYPAGKVNFTLDRFTDKDKMEEFVAENQHLYDKPLQIKKVKKSG